MGVRFHPNYTPANPRRVDREHLEAVSFVKQVRLNLKRWPDLRWLAHVPNGGKRGKVTAGKLKAEGTKRGVPDYLMPVRRGDYIGLAIELKAPGGTTSPEQREWLAHLRSQGWRAEVAVGAAAAWELVREYMEQ